MTPDEISTVREDLSLLLQDGRVKHAIRQHCDPRVYDAVQTYLTSAQTDEYIHALALVLLSNRRVRKVMERVYGPQAVN